jgi:hypothetical protein
MPAIPVETLAAGYKVVHMVPKGQVTTAIAAVHVRFFDNIQNELSNN